MKIRVREFFAGFGLMTRALTDGLRAAGHEVIVDAAAELEPQYLEAWSERHPGASTFCGSVGRYHPAELSIPGEGFKILVAGIPCTGASVAGRSKNHLAHPEEHHTVGHLFLPVAHYIRLHRPDAVVFENVPPYALSLSARLLRQALRRCGYSLFEKIVDPHAEFETPSRRLRWVMVATLARPFAWEYDAKPFTGTLASYLDAPSERDEADSFSAAQVGAHASYIARKQAEGCGWATRLIDHSSTKAPTICKSYGKVQPSATFVKTKTSYRMLRPREVARLMGFPDSMPLPAVKTTAYEVFGQGVCYRPFRALGEAFGLHLADAPRTAKRTAPAQLELAGV